MIGTLAWKEYREHLTVWAALAGLAIFLIVTMTQAFAAQTLYGPPQARRWRPTASIQSSKWPTAQVKR